MPGQGIEVPREARPITVYELLFIRHEGNELELEVHCSKGTYIRTIIDDLGEKLGCGRARNVPASSDGQQVSGGSYGDAGAFADAGSTGGAAGRSGGAVARSIIDANGQSSFGLPCC